MTFKTTFRSVAIVETIAIYGVSAFATVMR